MPERIYKVRLFTLRTGETTNPTEVPGFSVTARNVDAARIVVKSRLAERGKVRSVSSDSPSSFIATIELPPKS